MNFVTPYSEIERTEIGGNQEERENVGKSRVPGHAGCKPPAVFGQRDRGSDAECLCFTGARASDHLRTGNSGDPCNCCFSLQQRISIARCILKDAPVILLDEATASVDADNEFYIQQAVSELCRDKTVLVIAHRLNTIRGADLILVLDKGRIVEQGSHVIRN